MGSCKATAQIAILVSVFGCLSFIFGIIAENKKPTFGTPIQGKGAVICRFPSDPAIPLGCLSIITLTLSSVAGVISIYYPYQGKKVPSDALFRSASMRIFFWVAIGVTVLSGVMILWATMAEALGIVQNVRHDSTTRCPTAKTGVFGGGAFLALDATLFWLICLMLTVNARVDYLDEGVDAGGLCGQVMTTLGGSPSVVPDRQIIGC